MADSEEYNLGRPTAPSPILLGIVVGGLWGILSVIGLSMNYRHGFLLPGFIAAKLKMYGAILGIPLIYVSTMGVGIAIGLVLGVVLVYYKSQGQGNGFEGFEDA